MPSLEDVATLVTSHHANARPLRALVAVLADGRFRALDELIRASALPRRTVEELLGAIGPDLDQEGAGARLRPAVAPAYLARFRVDQLAATALGDPLAARLAERGDLVATLEALIGRAPAPSRALDHVQATAETVVRRALWLDGGFDLDGARVLCLGDHDLSSLALAGLRPGVDLAVADVDDRVLAFIDAEAGGRVACAWADLRLGLPEALAGWADLVLTDPPYTPAGVGLFMAAGAQALRDRDQGRLVLAFGFSARHPALGLKVQQTLTRLGLVTEAIWPAFNRYLGAQAVGSASDLYVCRPTARTWPALERQGDGGPAAIYTHGPQAVEAAGAGLDEAEAGAALAVLGGDAPALVGGGWWSPGRAGLATVLAGGLPPALARSSHVALDLTGDPGGWLARALLAVNAERAVLVVGNQHPDLGDEAAQAALQALLAAKYRLRLRRGQPSARLALVEADRVDAAGLDRAGQLARWVLERGHGKVGNAWREGLIRLARRDGRTLTRTDARDLARAACRDQRLLGARPVELPRHQLRALLDDLAASAGT
jgi:hypothetical protein